MNNTNAPSPGRYRLWLASSFNEMLVTIWTCTSFYIMYATGGKNEFVLFIPLVFGAIGFVWMTFKKPVIARVDPLLSFGVFLMIFGILASYLFNSQQYEPIFIAGNLVSTLLLFVTLYTITTKIDLDLRKTLIFQCIFASPLFPLVLATSNLQWGRVMPAELTPNYVSMMAMVCFVGACCVRSLAGALVLSLIPLYTIVVMQSRGSMLAAGTAGLIIIGCRLKRYGWKKLRPYVAIALLAGPILCFALTLAGFDVLGKADDAFENLFLLNDESRGISSGASGRTDLWSAAINLWLSHPLFGVGFKGQQQIMPDHALSHNAYLGMLAEVGVVGFAGYMLIVVVALYHTLKRGDRGLSEYPQRVAILISYIFYGMIESRAFGFGNSYSLLFLLVAFDSSKFRLKNPLAFGSPRPKPSSPSLEPVSSPGLISHPKT